MICGIIELARVAWIYQTLAATTKVAVRKSIVHGEDCVSLSSSCIQSTSEVINTVRNHGIGLDLDQVSIELRSGTALKPCQPASSCLADGSMWPPESNNTIGTPLSIRASYMVQPMFLRPFAVGGTGITLTAASRESIQF